jgi:LEA14-like dessication related protein
MQIYDVKRQVTKIYQQIKKDIKTFKLGNNKITTKIPEYEYELAMLSGDQTKCTAWLTILINKTPVFFSIYVDIDKYEYWLSYHGTKKSKSPIRDAGPILFEVNISKDIRNVYGYFNAKRISTTILDFLKHRYDWKQNNKK